MYYNFNTGVTVALTNFETTHEYGFTRKKAKIEINANTDEMIVYILSSINSAVDRYPYGNVKLEEPTKIIFNGPATIAFWPDGTKTTCKVKKGETFDPEIGVMVCYMKKIFGGNSYKKTIRKFVKDDKPSIE